MSDASVFAFILNTSSFITFFFVAPPTFPFNLMQLKLKSFPFSPCFLTLHKFQTSCKDTKLECKFFVLFRTKRVYYNYYKCRFLSTTLWCTKPLFRTNVYFHIVLYIFSLHSGHSSYTYTHYYIMFILSDIIKFRPLIKLHGP